MSKVIAMVPYRDEWPGIYRDIARTLAPVLPDGSRLHHIGSTAIPGLCAKNVIDMQLTVERLEEVAIGQFEQAGFAFKPDRQDHDPAGAGLPLAERTKLYFTRDTPAVHLHVRERGRFHQRYALLFRDYLRAEPAVALAYGAIKSALAERTGGDPAAYYAVKDPVCDAIKAGAELWARTTGWQDPPAD